MRSSGCMCESDRAFWCGDHCDHWRSLIIAYRAAMLRSSGRSLSAVLAFLGHQSAFAQARPSAHLLSPAFTHQAASGSAPNSAPEQLGGPA